MKTSGGKGGNPPANLFPPGTFDPSDGREDSRQREWPSRQLAAMKEKALAEHAAELGAREAYRYTNLPTWFPARTVRLALLPGEPPQVNAIRKVGRGQAGFDAKGLQKSEKLKVSARQWEKLVSMLGKHGFWENDLRNGPDSVPNRLDGTARLLEGFWDGEFRAFLIYTPATDLARRICRFFQSFAPVPRRKQR